MSQAFAEALTMVAALVFLFGLVSIVKPEWFGLQTRWQATFAWSMWIPVCAISTAVDPNAGEAGQGALIAVVVQTLLSGTVALLRIGWRLRRRRQDGELPSASTPWLERMTDQFQQAQMAAEARRDAALAEIAAREAEAARKARLAEIVAAERAMRDHRYGTRAASKRSARSARGKSKPAALIPAVQNERAWQSAKDQAIEDRLGPILSGSRTEKLSFSYEDSKGEVTSRVISNWREYANHFAGHCHLRGGDRTFAKDGVVEWHDGSELALQFPDGL